MKISIKKIIVFSIIAILSCFLLSKYSNSKKIDPSSNLIVGTQAGFPPFEYINDKGDIVGFDIDLGKQLATKLNKQLIVKNLDFDALILALKQNKIDIILSGMSILESRLQEINMIPYYDETAPSLDLVFWKTIPNNISSIEDIENLRLNISLEVGSISEDFIKKYYPQIKITSFEGSLNPFLDVKFGKSTACVLETSVTKYLQKKYPEIKTISISLKTDQQVLGYGIGVNKNNIELHNNISKALQELKNEGALISLKKKWLGNK